MRTYVLPDQGPIVSVAGGKPLGWWTGAPLLGTGAVPATPPRPKEPGWPVAFWSGSLGGGLFEPSVMNWSERARQQLHEACDAWLAAHPGVHLWIRPHARHVLGDWNTACRFILARRAMGDGLTGLMVDPCALLTVQMLPKCEDHLRRTAEEVAEAAGGQAGADSLLPRDAVGVVVVCGVWSADAARCDPLGTDGGEPLVLGPFDDPRSAVAEVAWQEVVEGLGGLGVALAVAGHSAASTVSRWVR